MYRARSTCFGLLLLCVYDRCSISLLLLIVWSCKWICGWHVVCIPSLPPSPPPPQRERALSTHKQHTQQQYLKKSFTQSIISVDCLFRYWNQQHPTILKKKEILLFFFGVTRGLSIRFFLVSIAIFAETNKISFLFLRANHICFVENERQQQQQQPKRP